MTWTCFRFRNGTHDENLKLIREISPTVDDPVSGTIFY